MELSHPMASDWPTAPGGEGDNFTKIIVKDLKSGAETLVWEEEKK